MAHEIMGESFFARDKAAWHRLGTVVDKDWRGTVEEAFVIAGANYSVEKTPIGVMYGDKMWDTGRYMLVREPLAVDVDIEAGEIEALPRFFGEVGEDFEVVQNMEIAAALQPLHETWPIETVGVLQQGRTLFMTLKVGGFAVQGDEMEEYFLVSNGLDGKKALRIDFTPVRVVCNNTLTSGYSAASVSVKMTHKGGIRTDLKFWSEMLPQMKLARTKTQEMFAKLAETRITDDQAREVIEAAYILPKANAKAALKGELVMLDLKNPELVSVVEGAADLYDKNYANVEKLREASFSLYERMNDEHPNVGGTAWAAWQAVTELSDWRVPGRKTKKQGEIESAVFGGRAREKERGFAKAVSLIK